MNRRPAAFSCGPRSAPPGTGVPTNRTAQQCKSLLDHRLVGSAGFEAAAPVYRNLRSRRYLAPPV